MNATLHLLDVALPWVLSVITIWMTLLAGSMHPRAWLVGIGNQALWLVWIITTSTWGLLPMNLALAAAYWRNHFKQAAARRAPAPSHQDRVRQELAELHGRVARLGVFIHQGPFFDTLPADEQNRLRRQLDVMRELAAILEERIDHFTS